MLGASVLGAVVGLADEGAKVVGAGAHIVFVLTKPMSHLQSAKSMAG